jgi:hypothetical protein
VVTVIGLLLYYFALPPINFGAPAFWFSLFLYFGAISLLNSMIEDGTNGFNALHGIISILSYQQG